MITTMKTRILCMLAAILTVCGMMSSCTGERKGEAGKWTLEAQLTNPEDTIYVIPTDNIEEQNAVAKENGMFKFTTDLDETKAYIIVSPAILRGEAGLSFLVEAVPGEVLTVEGLCDEEKPANGLTFGGTKFYKYYTEVNTIQDKVSESEDIQPIIDFIKAHPDEEVSTVLISTVGYIVPDRLDEVLNLLSPEIRNGRMKGYIEQQVSDVEEYLKQKEIEGKTLEEGSEAPDFTLNDINGKPLTLSSLRGKYLVLDFWGSWCGWCIKGFPEMKEYYAKYKDKMEILGVDCNDTEEKWKNAVAENELPWLHVFVPRDSELTTDYYISGYPTKIIIDPDGKVVKTVVGEDPQFYEFLDELFK